jgi:hypothetical protein
LSTRFLRRYRRVCSLWWRAAFLCGRNFCFGAGRPPEADAAALLSLCAISAPVSAGQGAPSRDAPVQAPRLRKHRKEVEQEKTPRNAGQCARKRGRPAAAAPARQPTLSARPLLGPSARCCGTVHVTRTQSKHPFAHLVVCNSERLLPELTRRRFARQPTQLPLSHFLLVYCELLAVLYHWIDEKDTAQDYYIIALDVAGV